MAAKILVVDDDPNVQRTLAYTLKQEGYEVVVAGDGAEGFRLWSTESPALMLLDVMLPEARRLPGRGQDPRRRGRERPRPDHHAHRRARGGAEGPRPAGRRRRLPHQAVPPGGAARPDQEPAGPLRADARRSSAGRRSVGSTPTTARRAAWARRRSRSTRRSRSIASSAAGSPSSTATSSSATTASSSTSGLDRKSIVDVVTAPSIDVDLIQQVLVRHDSGIDLLLAPPSPETAELVDPGAHAPRSSTSSRTTVRLRPHRHRQAPRRVNLRSSTWPTRSSWS